MSDAWHLLADPQFPFVRRALLVLLLGAVPFGVLGSLLVSRKASYLVAAVAHGAVGGVGAALFLFGQDGFAPTAGGMAAAVALALLYGWLGHRRDARTEAVIAAIWVLGMGSGLLLMRALPTYVDPFSYLFGDLLLVGPADIYAVAALALVALALVAARYRQWVSLCFDAEFARLRGVPVNTLERALYVLGGATVALLASTCGLLLVIALLTLPAALAGRFARSLSGMMLGATLASALLGTSGVLLATAADWPLGPALAVLAGTAYLLASTLGKR